MVVVAEKVKAKAVVVAVVLVDNPTNYKSIKEDFRVPPFLFPESGYMFLGFKNQVSSIKGTVHGLRHHLCFNF